MNQSDFLKTVIPFKDKVFRLAKRLLVSTEEAEDATQELYFKLWKNKEKLTTYKNMEAFAMTMTKNYCFDRLKSKQASNISLVHTNYKEKTTSLDKKIEHNDSVNQVHELIKKLPEQQKIVIQLRDVEQYDFDEICKMTEMKPTAVRVTLSRARKTIREALIKNTTMELASIEKLLEKYLNATTSVQEEEILKKYFNSKEVAPHLKEYGMMFEYFKQSKSETFTKTIQLKPKNNKKSWKWLSIAASVALLISVFIGKQAYDKHQQRKQFAQVKEALQLISFNLNKGNDALYAVSNNLTIGSDAVSKLDTYNKTVNTVINKVNY